MEVAAGNHVGIAGRLAVWACALAGAVIATSAASAQQDVAKSCPPTQIRPQDEIWLVSTRRLDGVCGRLTAVPHLDVWKYDHGQNAWKNASVESLVATDNPETPTNVFVHGNWLGFSESVESGFVYYRHQAAFAPSPRPLRVVLWSWPSTRGRRPIRDTRAKYARTDAESVYLAWFLGRISPRVKVSLVGYSFGSPIILGGLHALSQHGGTLAGEAVSSEPREPVRAVLFAAAQDADALASGHEHELALHQTEKLLNLTNSCDPALKLFRFVDKCVRPDALGYWGISVVPGEQVSKIQQVDCASIVGKQHYWRPYVTSPELIERMRPYVWFDDVFAAPETK